MGKEGRRGSAAFGDVLAAAQRGEEWALDRLYREYEPLLLRFFRTRRCGDDAEDLAMEVWDAVLRGGGLATFRGSQEAFAGWLITIARRRLVDHHRRWGRRRPEAASTEAGDRADVRGGGGDPAEVVDTRVTTDEALDLLAEVLTPRQLEAVLLHVVGGYKLVEVARMMGRSANSVTVMYHRAMKRLAKRLSQESDL